MNQSNPNRLNELTSRFQAEGMSRNDALARAVRTISTPADEASDDVANTKHFIAREREKLIAQFRRDGMGKDEALTAATRSLLKAETAPPSEMEALVRGFQSQGLTKNEALARTVRILATTGELSGPDAVIRRFLATGQSLPADIQRRRAPFELVEVRPSGEATFVASNEDIDSHGTVIRQDWDLTRYRDNPVVLWNHDVCQPIGVATVHVDGTRTLVADVTFAKNDELASRIANLVAQKVVRGISVGFRASRQAVEKVNGRDVTVLSGNVLHELSITPVPSNQKALAR